jgi:hypothetical protein
MLKNLLKYAMIFMATVSLFALSACGDDDDDSVQTSSDLVGVWAYLDEIENDNYDTWEGFQFNSDGTGINGEWDSSKKKFVEVYEHFTWSATSTGKVMIHYTAYDELWIANYIIGGDYLYMWEDGEEMGSDKLKRIK